MDHHTEEEHHPEADQAEGGKNEDNPSLGEGTGEGDRGLGTQTDAAGGGNSEPMRGQNPTGEGAAAHGGAPNEETREGSDDDA